MNKPGIYPVYKRSAAAQFALILPTHNEKGWLERQGAVLIEAAVAVGTNANENIEYGWGNKITFSLGPNDLNSLFENPDKPLIHQWKGSTKSVRFQPGSGKYEGTWMMHVNEKTDTGTENKISVPVGAGEWHSLNVLLRAALPKMLGW